MKSTTSHEDQFNPAEEEAWRELEQRQGKQTGGGADSPNAWVIEADRLVCAFVKAELGRDNAARQAAAEAMRKHLLTHPAAQGQDAEPTRPVAIVNERGGIDFMPGKRGPLQIGDVLYTHPPSAQAEPLHITHGPLMREAAALLRLRKPVLSEFERVAAKLDAAIDGQPTPADAPSQEWLDVAAVAEADHFRGATKMVQAEPVSGADELPALLRDGPYLRDGKTTLKIMAQAADEIERLRGVRPSGNAGELPQPDALRLVGVGKDARCPKSLQVYLSREPTDDEVRMLHQSWPGIAASNAALAAQDSEQDLEDAERYRHLRSIVYASNPRGEGSWAFHYDNFPTPLTNPLKGSVAQHFDAAVDAARTAAKGEA